MNFKKKALLAGLFTVAASSVAFAAFKPTHHVEVEYYSDAAKTQFTGSRIYTCTGRVISVGSTSAYSTEETRRPCRSGGGL